MKKFENIRVVDINDIDCNNMLISKRLMDGSVYPLHWHRFIEIEIMTDGEIYQRYNGAEYKISKGYVSVLRQTDFHEIFYSKNAQYFNISVPENLIDNNIYNLLFDLGDYAVLRLAENEFSKLKTIVEQLYSEFNTAETYRAECISHLVYLIFIYIIRNFNNIDTLNFKHNSPIENSLIYINNHFRENPSLKEVAAIANLSPNYFSDSFHKTICKTFSEYLCDIKLNYAARLLETTSLPINEIFISCGFTSYPNFSKKFNQKFLHSPSKHRRIKSQI